MENERVVDEYWGRKLWLLVLANNRGISYDYAKKTITGPTPEFWVEFGGVFDAVVRESMEQSCSGLHGPADDRESPKGPSK